jgi:hypothetical protein
MDAFCQVASLGEGSNFLQGPKEKANVRLGEKMMLLYYGNERLVM